MVDDDDDGRSDDGRTPDHGHPISSPALIIIITMYC